MADFDKMYVMEGNTKCQPEVSDKLAFILRAFAVSRGVAWRGMEE